MAKTKASTANGQRNGKSNKESDAEPYRYRVLVSKRFVFLSLLSCILAAFAVGRTARMMLLVYPQKRLLQMAGSSDVSIDQTTATESAPSGMKSLPDPKMKDGKYPPETLYTSKTFGTGSTVSSQSRWIVTDAGKENCVDLPEHECPVPPSFDSAAADSKNGTGEVHLPAGQHLLLDIDNVDGSFLNSEERLADAMLELVGECGLTLLSYHCHKMVPMGVSCAGVLLESHVSFHTWPKEGVITLDLYTCGPNSLLPIVPLAKQLFAVPREGGEGEKPRALWAHKTRGYPQGDMESLEAEMTDMEYFPVGKIMDYKNEIAFTSTKFQTIRVYDVLRPNKQTVEAYKKSLKDDGSYESNNPELFEPDRIVYLDGVLQSRRSGEAAYHETLIHPSMFAHKNPKRVAIIGGGEGASLREVLKHKTVENVTMIEIDKMMVDASRKFLPSWSDCSMLKGSVKSCFDDSRVEVQYRDAFQWFIDNFPAGKSALVEAFDVIIMDALDPQIQKDFVDALYDEGPFLKSIPNALTDDGIFISQVGESVHMEDPVEQNTDNRNRVKLVKSLSRLGFTTVRSYSDSMQSGFFYPWQFITAFKNTQTKADWLANPSLVNLKIRQRAMVTVDGGSPFKFFDGATMQSFYYPPKPIEAVYCRGNPDSKQCSEGQGFDLNRENLPISVIEVKESSNGDDSGRGVFAKVDIPRDSYVGLDKGISTVHGDAQTYEILKKTENAVGGRSWASALNLFGEISSHTGKDSFIVHPTIQMFTNQAGDGNNNIGFDLSQSNGESGILYNPAADRQVKFYNTATPRQDIKQGEEHLRD